MILIVVGGGKIKIHAGICMYISIIHNCILYIHIYSTYNMCICVCTHLMRYKVCDGKYLYIPHRSDLQKPVTLCLAYGGTSRFIPNHAIFQANDMLMAKQSPTKYIHLHIHPVTSILNQTCLKLSLGPSVYGILYSHNCKCNHASMDGVG